MGAPELKGINSRLVRAPKEEQMKGVEDVYNAVDATLEKAIAIAVDAHAGQKDKAGRPYILHPLRVMMCMDTEKEMMAAVLHDVIEDTNLELDDLADKGIPKEVIEAVDLLTKPDDGSISYEDYLKRIKESPLARRVKLADISDNGEPERTKYLKPDDRERLGEKYKKAREILEAPKEWQYFALVGDAGPAYGVIRTEVGGYDIERFDIRETFDWQDNPDACKYLNGMNNDAMPCTEQEAMNIAQKLKQKFGPKG